MLQLVLIKQHCESVVQAKSKWTVSSAIIAAEKHWLRRAGLGGTIAAAEKRKQDQTQRAGTGAGPNCCEDDAGFTIGVRDAARNEFHAPFIWDEVDACTATHFA